MISWEGTLDTTDLAGFAAENKTFNLQRIGNDFFQNLTGSSNPQKRFTATGVTLTGSIGTTTNTAADSYTGDVFGFNSGQIWVAQNYTSGSTISGTQTYNSTTAADLNISEAFSLTWGSGATADSITVDVVPEPASTSLLGLGALTLLLRRRR